MFESEDLEYHKGKYYGLYRGYVYDNKDPENMGRLRLCVPSALGLNEKGKPIVSDWAYPMFPIAGDGWGVQCIPRIKNPDNSRVMVWVAFEMGDTNCPVWMGSPIPEGGLQSQVQKNHSKVIKGKSTESCFAFETPRGNKIVLDDYNEKITFESSDKDAEINVVITLDSKNNIATLKTDTNTIVLSKGGVKIATDKTITLTTENGTTVF